MKYNLVDNITTLNNNDLYIKDNKIVLDGGGLLILLT